MNAVHLQVSSDLGQTWTDVVTSRADLRDIARLDDNVYFVGETGKWQRYTVPLTDLQLCG